MEPWSPLIWRRGYPTHKWFLDNQGQAAHRANNRRSRRVLLRPSGRRSRRALCRRRPLVRLRGDIQAILGRKGLTVRACGPVPGCMETQNRLAAQSARPEVTIAEHSGNDLALRAAFGCAIGRTSRRIRVIAENSSPTLFADESDESRFCLARQQRAAMLQSAGAGADGVHRHRNLGHVRALMSRQEFLRAMRVFVMQEGPSRRSPRRIALPPARAPAPEGLPAITAAYPQSGSADVEDGTRSLAPRLPIRPWKGPAPRDSRRPGRIMAAAGFRRWRPMNDGDPRSSGKHFKQAWRREVRDW